MNSSTGDLYLYSGITIVNNTDDESSHTLYDRITNTYKDKYTYTMVLSYVTADTFKEIRHRISDKSSKICSSDKLEQLKRVILILTPINNKAISRIESTALRFMRELMEQKETRSYILILTDYPNTAGYSHVDYSKLKTNFKVKLAR